MKPSEILDIITIIYYAPAFALSLFVAFKHGFGKQSGWISITLLSIFRLVGSALGIAAVSHPSSGVIIGSLILSSMGTISLLGALAGISKRVNKNMSAHAIPTRLTRYVQLITTAAVVLAIIGGNWAFSSDSSKQSEGRTLYKVAIFLLLIVYLASVAMVANETINKRYILAEERRLLTASTMSLPFILVRLILAFCAAFRPTDPVFSIASTSNSAIIVRALMGILMEFIVVALFLWAGLTVNAETTRQGQTGQSWYNPVGARQGARAQQEGTEYPKADR